MRKYLKFGSSQAWLFQAWLFGIFTRKCSFALFCALLRSSALFCGLAFALFCARLRSFARIYVFLRPTAFRTTAFGNCREVVGELLGKLENSGKSREFPEDLGVSDSLLATHRNRPQISGIAAIAVCNYGLLLQLLSAQHCRSGSTSLKCKRKFGG